MNKVRDFRKNSWYRIDGVFLKTYGRSLGPQGISTYNALAMYANSEEQCFPSLNTIGELIGLCRTSVVHALDALEALRLIARERRTLENGGSTTTLYTLLDVEAAAAQADRGGCSPDKQGGCLPDEQGGVHQINRGCLPDEQPCIELDLSNETYLELDPPIVPPSGDGVGEEVDASTLQTETAVVTKEESSVTYSPGFTQFWETWPASPRKVKKYKAWQLWKRLGLERRSGEVCTKLSAWKGSDQWQRGYEPLPTSWLNARLFDEDPPPPQAAVAQGPAGTVPGPAPCSHPKFLIETAGEVLYYRCNKCNQRFTEEAHEAIRQAQRHRALDALRSPEVAHAAGE